MAQKFWSLIAVLVIQNARWVMIHKILPAVVVHVFNPNAYGAEADGSLEFEASLFCTMSFRQTGLQRDA